MYTRRTCTENPNRQKVIFRIEAEVSKEVLDGNLKRSHSVVGFYL